MHLRGPWRRPDGPDLSCVSRRSCRLDGGCVHSDVRNVSADLPPGTRDCDGSDRTDLRFDFAQARILPACERGLPRWYVGLGDAGSEFQWRDSQPRVDPLWNVARVHGLVVGYGATIRAAGVCILTLLVFAVLELTGREFPKRRFRAPL